MPMLWSSKIQQRGAFFQKLRNLHCFLTEIGFIWIAQLLLLVLPILWRGEPCIPNLRGLGQICQSIPTHLQMLSSPVSWVTIATTIMFTAWMVASLQTDSGINAGKGWCSCH